MNNLIAVKKEENVLTVALRNPFDMDVLDELRVLVQCNTKHILSKEEDIQKAIRVHYGFGAETVEKLVRDSDSLKTHFLKKDAGKIIFYA
jgi:hypothetical protein